jgi:fluoroquinolone transport system permease protein
MSVREEASVILIFSDTSVLGLIFVGAIVLLEKQQGVLQSMSVTPLRLETYLFSKVFSLTLLSSIVSSLIWIVPRFSFDGYFILLAGVILSSIVFTMFGIGLSAGVNSFNQFLARVIVGSLALSLPVVPMFVLTKTGYLLFLPTNAAVDLFLRITKESFLYIQLIDLLVLACWAYLMTLFAKRKFKNNNLFI